MGEYSSLYLFCCVLSHSGGNLKPVRVILQELKIVLYLGQYTYSKSRILNDDITKIYTF